MTAHEATLRQRDAADPDASVWVAANAGSGKTRVLTERVARLLLTGARPDRILCLTYTKAAAAEMQTRLFAMLGGWAMADDRALEAALVALNGAPTGAFDAEGLNRARRLFAEALETPGGLKIQTIHSFCEGVLRRFPVEAGAPPGFRVIEEREQAELVKDILDTMAAPGSGAEAAFDDVAALVNSLEAVAGPVIATRNLFPAEVDEAAIADAFGAPAPPDPTSARLAALDELDEDALEAMLAAWRAGSKTEVLRAQGLAEARERGRDELAIELTGALLTKEGVPRSKPANKDAQAAEPDWETHCSHLAEVAMEVRAAEIAAETADRALRLARFGGALVARYEAAKAARALLDFDDLIARTQALVTNSASRDWALYRLDGGVDHILVDEAQDTSRAQWDVIDAIASEFRAGIGAREGTRTSFVVGDEKQSIYRFQGAAPEMFAEMRERFATALAGAGGQREADLAHSFRSAPAILRAVDATFQGDRAAGLSAAGTPPLHKAFHDARAGRVELWPLIKPVETGADPEPWAPVDMPGADDPRARLADAVAERIAAMVGVERLPGAGGRTVRAGDILILLPARQPMLPLLIRGLKARGVPVAGADRLALLDELAVKDLLALLSFAATPEDDLALAALLRSPLFGIDETALFDLAHGRDGSLWRAVRNAPRHAAAAERLSEALARADYARPFEMLELALTGWGGRRRLIGRLGVEAEDAVDELLAQALAYEQTGAPSLIGFLDWLDRGATEVKRTPDGGRDEVRVMTVHGAKGQEAPVVFLPDTMKEPRNRFGPVAAIETASGPRAAWRGAKGAEPAALAATRVRDEREEAEERRRLLYVAMTRAEDWLIIAGAGEDDPEKIGERWYGMVRAGLEAAGAVVAQAPLDGDMLVLEDEREGKPDPAHASGATAAMPVVPSDAPLPAPRPRERVAASALAPHEFAAAAGGLAPDMAARRGEAIHAALESGETDPAALARAIAPFGLPEDIAAEAAAEALRARRLPEAAPFFAPEAIAEAGVSLEMADRKIVGRIDRLIVTPERIAFVDFKSDAAPPARIEDAPAGYLAQLAAYRAALSGIYPGRQVAAHILWTAQPRLDIAPDALLDETVIAPAPS